MQAHPRASKEERRSLCRLIDARKLSTEAAAHAVQNDRLPVRCVLQVLFSSSEHGGGQLLNHHRLAAEWSGGSFRHDLQARSPAAAVSRDLPSAGAGRCPSKREVHHHEMRRLREDVARLQVGSNTTNGVIESVTRSASVLRMCGLIMDACVLRRCSATRCRRRWTG
jgi:hypothetical protein